MQIKRVNVLGVGLSVLNLPSALTAMADAVRARRKGYICVTGVHGVMEAQARAQAGAPAFVYQVNFESPLSQGRLKACHMIDIPLMFGTTATPGALCGNGEDARSLSRRLRDMLGRFARTGNPDGPGLPDWPPYELDRRSTLALETTPRLINDPRAEERRFFAAYPFIQRGTI